MKILNRKLALAAIGICCLTNTPVVLAGTPEMDLLQQQVEQLLKQNEQLARRIADLENGTPPQPAATGPDQGDGSQAATHHKEIIEKEVARQLKAKGGQKVNDYVTLSGLIEGDIVFAEDYEGNSSSEFALAAVELGLDVEATEWAAGHLHISYDSDDDDLFIEEASVILGNTETFPMLLTAGKVYMPFGDYSTNMIRDPLTLTIGEINAPGVIGGFESNGVAGVLFGYSGMNETGSDDSIKGLGAALTYSYEKDELNFNTGVSWVSNIADAGGITDVFDETGIESLESAIDGFNIHLGIGFGAFSLISEYVGALESFAAAELSFTEAGAEPSAWNTELAYTTELLARETVFAVGYQQTSEALALGLPSQRLSTAGSMVVFEGTTLALEYYLDHDYSLDDGGTDEKGYGFTTRLAYQF